MYQDILSLHLLLNYVQEHLFTQFDCIIPNRGAPRNQSAIPFDTLAVDRDLVGVCWDSIVIPL